MNTALAPVQSEAPSERQQFLSFQGASELCAVPINRVEEIIDPLATTPVPQTPVFVQGVANLRGDVLPIIDFSLLTNNASKGVNKRQCIIVVSVQHEEHTQRLGLLVDQVEAVFDLNREQLVAAPEFGLAIDQDCVQGISNTVSGFIALIDLDRLLQLEKLKPT